MFESKIKEVAGLPIIKGEPVILDAVQTIDKQYKALDKKRINRAAWLSDF